MILNLFSWKFLTIFQWSQGNKPGGLSDWQTLGGGRVCCCGLRRSNTGSRQGNQVHCGQSLFWVKINYQFHAGRTSETFQIPTRESERVGKIGRDLWENSTVGGWKGAYKSQMQLNLELHIVIWREKVLAFLKGGSQLSRRKWHDVQFFFVKSQLVVLNHRNKKSILFPPNPHIM